jgi:hypothetical protein
VNKRIAMTVQMLVMTFKFNTTPAEYAQAMTPLTGEILNSRGLRWKIWLINKEQCIASGLYLFDDSESVQTFLASPLMYALQDHPSFSEVRVMPFDVLEAQTAATHGPLGAGVRV